MSTIRSAFCMSAGLAIAATAALSAGALAANPVIKDEAVAMVKKAVAAIKAEGAEKANASTRRQSAAASINSGAVQAMMRRRVSLLLAAGLYSTRARGS